LVIEDKLLNRVTWWFVMVPIYLAYRLIWLMAKTGQPSAQTIHLAMWQADLDIPPITDSQKKELIGEGEDW
jgi:hypothetical protein